MKQLLIALALAFATLGPWAHTTHAQQTSRPLPETQIKDRLDEVVRWMRTQQERNTGAYGDAPTTAWVLWALGDSPRKYRPGDGAFVDGALAFLLARQMENGAFRDEAGEADVDLSRLATRALFVHQNKALKPAYGKALVWLGTQGFSDPLADLLPPSLELEAARKHVRELMATCVDGHWNHSTGPDLLQTARNSVDLARYARLFQEPDAVRPVVPLGPFTAADRDTVLEAMQRGAAFLVQAASDGKYGLPGQPDAGLTVMAISGLQGMPTPRDAKVQAIIDEGLEWLVSLQKPDGSIHQGRLANYVTSSAVMALARSGVPAHQEAVKRAQAYLLRLQADEGEGYSEGDRYYGGIGYGDDERPDLSNLQMALDALDASGLPKDHPAYQRALKFLERCQNRSESNDVELETGEGLIVPGNDGGSAYQPGESKAGYVELPDGKKVPRSYGSMTYALLKSYVLAGLKADDPRVRAAFDWLQANYTVDVNPGFDTSRDPHLAYQGLFYYFFSMARALNVLGVEAIKDSSGKVHAWKRELAGRLIGMQDREAGFWINQNAPRWFEGNPVLGTSYALSVLSETLK